MSSVGRLVGGLKALFRSRRTEQELDEELRAYLEASIDQKESRPGCDGRTRAARLVSKWVASTL